MKNIAIWIQYDGSRYKGWQRQTNTEMTIQGKIEAVLSKMLETPVVIYGAGRTDAGVHAKGQVANFQTETEMEAIEMKQYLNAYLPQDIRIDHMKEMSPHFHSRLNAKSKVYCYRIRKQGCYDVFTKDYVWPIEESISIERMEKAAVQILGKHDFSSFCTKASKKKGSVRELYHLDIEETDNDIFFWFHGNGFLYNMVRIIVGTLYEIGIGKRESENMKIILNSKNRRIAGETAPAKGLILWRIDYE